MTKWDLKYRPSRFSDVLGNEGVKKLLLTRSRQGSLADQSMMFGGPKGCGKTTMARIVARSILCGDLGEDGEPCGSCPSCVAIGDGVSDSVQELDAASQGTVDRIREMVHDADYEGGVQVYILDEAQRLSKSAQDALLKAVEERLFIVILCTTEPHKIQGPIRDRVEEYPVYAPPQDALVSRMIYISNLEGLPYEPGALEAVASMNGNTPRSSYLSLGSLAALGGATMESVRQFFRVESYDLVDKALGLLDSDPLAAFRHLDALSARESPTWIRDAIVQAVQAGLRSSVGARSSFPVPLTFWPARSRGWCNMAMSLGAIDRPNMADVEAVLLSDSPSIPVVAGGPVVVRLPVSATPPSHDDPSPKASSPPDPPPADPDPSPPEADAGGETPPPDPDPAPKEVEIDGVKFSADETLTSLDKKIGGSIGAPKPEGETAELVQVWLDKSRTPIPERQFVNGFLRTFKGPG